MLIGMTDTYHEPDGIAARGTVLVAAGRGETTAAYQRFGRRIAADGYRVRVLPDVAADPAASFAEAEKLLVDADLPGRKVIVGADTGGLFALALAGRRAPGLDAVVLAGLPVPRPAGINLLGWDAEIEARTGCPNHRGVLAATATSLLSAPIPTEFICHTGDVSVPTLGLHGDADTISPLDEARAAYPGPLVTIAGGRHDVLNDLNHRTAAATVVLFLERLKLGADLPKIAQVAA
jgi:alpha-beta hydrolase superfamily lysophospholipase